MSRGRPILHPYKGDYVWFDKKKGNQPATDEHLELLSIVENVELDDILDESLTTGEVLYRLRDALGHLPPGEVLRRQNKYIEDQHSAPKCRICGEIGQSTKHHFVNKWLLRELSNYQQRWADRSKNCIPLCIHCHRKLHSRKSGVYSIVNYLTDSEKLFTEKALSALAEERPKLLILIGRGDDEVYESRLIKDWMEGLFQVTQEDDKR